MDKLAATRIGKKFYQLHIQYKVFYLIPKVNKELKKPNIQTPDNVISKKKCHEALNRAFSKEDSQIAEKMIDEMFLAPNQLSRAHRG